ncbi:hypothetical protein EV182_002055 [Spiromyces aspiralis]|uniref:Uncharacterized protein n=1 Tax=Spiromyces aspiralis TaxID=68401 RepID=A0ACC1HIU5_9FUNG|nr:hypothetical protein EV182_002055 [Spiromyces aspiralis]
MSGGDTCARDIRYGPLQWHRLDLFVPEAAMQSIAREEPERSRWQSRRHGDGCGWPVIVVCPGYRWVNNATDQMRLYNPMAQNLCNDGYFVILPWLGVGKDEDGSKRGHSAGRQKEYSLVSVLQDLQLVLEWTHQQMPEYGGDTGQIYLMGAGAGAHICAMYGIGRALQQYYARQSLQTDQRLVPILSSQEADRELWSWCMALRDTGAAEVKGLILISGVFDLVFQQRYEQERCLDGLTMTSFLLLDSPVARAEAWSPQLILEALQRRGIFIDINKLARRVLFIHGRKDTTFPFASSHGLFRTLCQWDVEEVNMKVYANLRRVDPTVALLSPTAPLTMSLLDDIRGIILEDEEDSDDNDDGDIGMLPVVVSGGG